MKKTAIYTVLIPHNNIVSELQAEQTHIAADLNAGANLNSRGQSHAYRMLPLCCFLSGAEKSPASWKADITKCSIEPPLRFGNLVYYPVAIEMRGAQENFSLVSPLLNIPSRGIVTAFIPDVSPIPDGASTTAESQPLAGNYPERNLRVFQLCSLKLNIQQDSSTVENGIGMAWDWSIEETLWVRCT